MDDAPILEESPPAPAEPREMTPAEKAKARQARILAKQAQRMKLVAGEISSLHAEEEKQNASQPPPPAEPAPSSSNEDNHADQNPNAEDVPSPRSQEDFEHVASATAIAEPAPMEAPPPPTTTTTTSSSTPARSRWEQRWEQRAFAAETRELPEDVVQRLQRTEELFVDAPRAQPASTSTPSSTKTLPTPSTRNSIQISPSLVATLSMLAVSVWAGVEYQRRLRASQEKGERPPSSEDVLALPLESVLLLALVLQVLVRFSLRVLGIREPKPQSSGWLMDTIFRFVSMLAPGISRASSLASAMRDCVDDTFTFVLGFGTGSAVVRVVEERWGS